MFKKKAPVAGPDSILDSRYYDEGSTWEKSNYRLLKGAAGFWRIYGIFASVVAILFALALYALIPLQKTDLVVLQVDKMTGYMHVEQPLTDTSKLTANDAVTASNIVQFIQARETYDPYWLQNNYDKAMLFAKGDAARDLKVLFNGSDSPMKTYGKDGRVSVQIESLNFLNDETALVRFTTTTIMPNGPPKGVTYYWAANVRYAYSSTPLRQDWRFINPLGFQVFEYRKDQERIAPVVNN
jgi:type IV secretion system protein VirB8